MVFCLDVGTDKRLFEAYQNKLKYLSMGLASKEGQNDNLQKNFLYIFFLRDQWKGPDIPESDKPE